MKQLPNKARFRAMVCEMLGIPIDVEEQQLKQALESRGNDVYSWYKTRMRSIDEFVIDNQRKSRHR